MQSTNSTNVIRTKCIDMDLAAIGTCCDKPTEFLQPNTKTDPLVPETDDHDYEVTTIAGV